MKTQKILTIVQIARDITTSWMIILAGRYKTPMWSVYREGLIGTMDPSSLSHVEI